MLFDIEGTHFTVFNIEITSVNICISNYSYFSDAVWHNITLDQNYLPLHKGAIPVHSNCDVPLTD
jgi:hypothetical protein